MKKQVIVTILKYGLGLGLLAWVVWRFWEPTPYGPGLAQALEKEFNALPFACAVGCYFFGILLTFYRWFVLVRTQDLPFTVADSARLGLIGFYLSTVLPGSVGGDIVKAAFVAREQSRRTVAVATVMMDRFIGLCGLFWLVALIGGSAWASGQMHYVSSDPEAVAFLEMIVTIAVGATAGSFMVWFVAGFISDDHSESFARGLERVPKIGGSLAELWRALHMYRQRGGSVLLTLLLSMVGHIGFVLTFYLAAQTLTPVDEIPTLSCHFLIVPVGMTIEAGVPSPGGVGGGEVAFGTLYHMVGFTVAAGVLGSLVRRVITWGLGLLGYLVYLRMKPALRATPPTDPLPAQMAEKTG